MSFFAEDPSSVFVDDLVEATRREVYGQHRAQYNRLANAYVAADEMFAFDFGLAGIVEGAYVSIEEEIVFIWSTTTSGKTATVQRGMQGTIPADHAAGTIVEVNARFPRFVIREQLRNEIASWPEDVFRVETTDVTIGSGDVAIDLVGVSGFYTVLEVLRSPRSTGGRWRRARGRLERTAPDDFPDGVFFINEFAAGAETVRVTAAMPMTTVPFTGPTPLSDIGLSESMMDIPVLGASWRLLAGREVKRTDTSQQGEPRAFEENPAGSITGAARALLALRDKRLAEEAWRLRMRYPWRLS